MTMYLENSKEWIELPEKDIKITEKLHTYKHHQLENII